MTIHKSIAAVLACMAIGPSLAWGQCPQSQARCRLLPLESRGKKAETPCEIHIPAATRSFIG